MRAKATFPLVVLFLLLGTAIAENWPHWRGPTRDGNSSEKSLPTDWSPSEGITWKLEMPAWSGSTPIIWGDYIFINTAGGGERQVRRRGRGRGGSPPAAPPPRSSMTTQPEEKKPDPEAGKLSLLCLDRNQGRVIWERPLGEGNRQMRKQNMSSPSPVTDGTHVWVMTGTGILKAFDFSGNEKWSRDIQADYGQFGLNWGYASSPLLYDGMLYVQVLHGMRTDDPSYLLGIDPASGQTQWRVERPTDAPRESPDSYTTPAVLKYDGKVEIVVTGGDYVTGHDPSNGKELWRRGGLNPKKAGNYRIVASPLVRDDVLYVPTRKNPLQAFRTGGASGRPELIWKTEDGPDVPTPVTDGEFLYIVRDNGVMLCLNARSGELVWGPERVRPGTYSASPVLADGKIYATSEDGVTSVVEASDEFKLLAENDLESYTLSSPAISDGQIFIRTEKFLYCIGKRRSGS